jgi:glutathione S-transferase
MIQSPLPILYSYRRCPYAMRARMALHVANIAVEIREISLRDKPAHMLQVSPKGTVPVLVLNDGQVIEQSIDIMDWALQQNDPQDWLAVDDMQRQYWIEMNDGPFKAVLDCYKYPERFPALSQVAYRAQGEAYLQQLESALQQHRFILGHQASIVDVALFPFIRQFSAVDAVWFGGSKYRAVLDWLNNWVGSELFTRVMQKYPTHLD